MDHELGMQLALEQARLAGERQEVPIGAALMLDSKLIAASGNETIGQNDASAHAEIQVIRKAGQVLGNHRLMGTTLYVTLEPCLMCAGAISQARIKHCVFGAKDPQRGCCGSVLDLLQADFLNHRTPWTSGVLSEPCGLLLNAFFSKKRLAKISTKSWDRSVDKSI